MKKIGIIGHLKADAFDGQTVKTKELYVALKEIYGEEQILVANLSESKKNPITFFSVCLKLMKQCENVIVLPAQNAIKILSPFLSFFKNKYSYKLFYSVIGGWLPEFLKKKRYLEKCLKNFNGIWVETNSMRSDLEQLGFKNIYVIPNFKDLTILPEEELTYNNTSTYKLCTFSRIMEEKGIEDAIKVVTDINENEKNINFILDIYGKIDSNYVERFNEMEQQFPEYIRYCGVIEPHNSVSVIKNYDLLLFPTKFKTEGIPGTIIDSYCAGVPVLSSKWNSFSDIIAEGRTGIGFEFDNYNDFKSKLTHFFDNTENVKNMKKNCIKEAEAFSKKSVMKKITNIIGE